MEDLNGTTGVVEDEDGDTLTTALSCFSKSLWRVRGGAGAGVLLVIWVAHLLQGVPRTRPLA